MGRTIAFEAAVGGGIPVIAAIDQSLVANQIESIHGILNGTSNFILTQMEDCGKTYAAALAEAQNLGFAEANPAMDVNGSDAAQKLAILAHLAFSASVDWKLIPRMGIDTVDVADMRYAGNWATASNCWRLPSWCPKGSNSTFRPRWFGIVRLWRRWMGRFNAIRIVGDAVGRVFLHGLGAGQMPTASACVADLSIHFWAHCDYLRALNLWSDAREAAVADARSVQCFGPFLRPLPRRRPPRRYG